MLVLTVALFDLSRKVALVTGAARQFSVTSR